MRIQGPPPIGTMMGNDRFYLPAYRDKPDRLPCLSDIGSMLTISGLVLQGMGSTLILMAPGAVAPTNGDAVYAEPNLDEWGEIIRASDDPQIFIGDATGTRKILHRKQRYAISGETQQRVWARDGFKCVYCFARFGETLMSIDHWIPLELGGANDTSNYVTSCRRCNKAKGMMMPEEFCKLKGFDYERLRVYVGSL